MLQEVTAAEIGRILEVTDALGIHREQVVIPLMPRHPGRLRRTPAGKLEIVWTPRPTSRPGWPNCPARCARPGAEPARRYLRPSTASVAVLEMTTFR